MLGGMQKVPDGDRLPWGLLAAWWAGFGSFVKLGLSGDFTLEVEWVTNFTVATDRRRIHSRTLAIARIFLEDFQLRSRFLRIQIQWKPR